MFSPAAGDRVQSVSWVLTRSRKSAEVAGSTSRTRMCSVVHAADFAKTDVLVVELLGQLIDGLVATLPDGFFNLHLQDQVAAALQVKSKLDAVRKVLLHLRARSGERRQPNHAVNAKNESRPAIRTNFHLSWELMRAG